MSYFGLWYLVNTTARGILILAIFVVELVRIFFSFIGGSLDSDWQNNVQVQLKEVNATTEKFKNYIGQKVSNSRIASRFRRISTNKND
jgi:hypothetical protein